MISFSDNIYVQGNFENYEYFNNYKNELSKFFIIKNELIKITRNILIKINLY